MPNEKPILALMYDFDKTLCTKDMQEYTFIPNVGMTPAEFWAEADALSEDNKMDGILAYMRIMLERAHAAKKSICRDEFVKLGKDLQFYPGVTEWFDKINKVGDEAGVKVEHYIISSGLHEIIEGSEIFSHFRDVFACEFLYDENDIACWPKNVVNYTTKTQYLFRINKGVLDLSNDFDLNSYTPEDDRPVPFRNMIYIGDGLTDVPCMKLVRAYGGYSIAVYASGKKYKVDELLKYGRVDLTAPADYTEGSELYNTVCDIMCSMAKIDCLIRKSNEQLKELK